MDEAIPTSAAERGWQRVLGLNEVEPEDALSWYTDDFVRRDRRRMIGAPDVGAAGFVAQIRAWFEIGKGRPVFTPVEIVATLGDRLVATRIRVGFPDDDAGVEMIHAALFDRDVNKIQRITSFDAEDRDAAITELRRLAAEFDLKR